MSINSAQAAWSFIAVYCGVGVVFALFFAWRGAGRLDARAAKGTRPFRLIIVPATTVFWPLLAWLWLRSPAATEADQTGDTGAGT